MAVALYMDEHVPRATTNGLRLRGVNVIATVGEPEDVASTVVFLPLT